MNESQKSILIKVLGDISTFHKQCAEEQSTDTGDCWTLFYAIEKDIKSLLRSDSDSDADKPIKFDKAILALNNPEVPMTKTHFYRYLKLGGYSDNSLVAKSNYLASLGFIKGTDTVQERTLQCLGYVLNHYYRIEVLKK